MAPLSFHEARERVLAEVRAARGVPPAEKVALAEAAGRVLAVNIAADRDSPALERSLRDGYAVRTADLPGTLEILGEVRAGERFAGAVRPGSAVEIMTGAPLPEGADAVVMVEYAARENGRVRIEGRSEPGQFINPRGAETAAGALVLRAGDRIDPSAVALLAACGHARVRVFRKPVVAILATGDEIVDVEAAPEPFQVRNSNSAALAAQVARAGGVARVLPVARDRTDETRALIESGLESELLLISGGVSAGRYDVVEPALAALGARFYFDRVRIQPGQPLVFGRARDRFFFGLPGNPASTLVTFELFARAALELLAGREEAPLLLPLARLTAEFRHSPGLTRFLPAHLGGDGAEVTPLAWHGSSDIPALARANCFLVADAARPLYACGDLIPVLLK